MTALSHLNSSSKSLALLTQQDAHTLSGCLERVLTELDSLSAPSRQAVEDIIALARERMNPVNQIRDNLPVTCTWKEFERLARDCPGFLTFGVVLPRDEVQQVRSDLGRECVIFQNLKEPSGPSKALRTFVCSIPDRDQNSQRFLGFKSGANRDHLELLLTAILVIEEDQIGTISPNEPRVKLPGLREAFGQIGRAVIDFAQGEGNFLSQGPDPISQVAVAHSYGDIPLAGYAYKGLQLLGMTVHGNPPQRNPFVKDELRTGYYGVRFEHTSDAVLPERWHLNPHTYIPEGDNDRREVDQGLYNPYDNPNLELWPGDHPGDDVARMRKQMGPRTIKGSLGKRKFS